VSPRNSDRVTLIASFIPFEAPYGGPNFFKFDDDVLYEIMIDNDGDAVEDVTFQFRFKTDVRNPSTFLYNTGPITSLDSANWNVRQSYSVTRVDGPRRTGRVTTLATNLPTPPVNVGSRSTPNYEALAAAAVQQLPNNSQVFAGQRDDPFFGDIGAAFDLVAIRNGTGATGGGRDFFAGYATHSIALQVPVSMLDNGTSHVIGVWAATDRQKAGVEHGKNRAKDYGNGNGNWVQVSRLGNPLINEVVIPTNLKDKWNATSPADDQQFEKYYSSPEVSRLENLLYGALPPGGPSNGHAGGALQAIGETGRSDLTTILLTGVPGFNQIGSSSTNADLLRLNTAIKPGANGACPGGTASSAPPDRLGPLGPSADLCGYPNGRRLSDDVVDIDLRAFAQGYGTFLNTACGLPNKFPNNQLGDGVDANDVPFSSSFPYVATPHQGYEVP